MTNKQEVITHLNLILENELVSINQYFVHYKILEDCGYEKLSAKIRQESIDEMKHADILIKRILFLKGNPDMNYSTKIKISSNVKNIFENDLALEVKAIVNLKDAIVSCTNAKDFGSKELLEEILKSEEDHIDFLSTQLDLINNIGLENYLSQQL